VRGRPATAFEGWLNHPWMLPLTIDIPTGRSIQHHHRLGWEFQFLVPISGTPIGSGILIPFLIPEIPVGFIF
jgi:hypothetical protein